MNVQNIMEDCELEIHQEGQEAFWNGLDSEDCPYDINSVGYIYWHDGYNDPRGDTE